MGNKKDDKTPTEDQVVNETGQVVEDPNLGSVQEPQSPSGKDLEETNDTPVNPNEGKAEAAEAPADPDDQEEDNPRASRKAGEASGPMSKEEKAAEKHPNSAKATNPVGEATQHESLDPYAAGHTIKNPEPNNGLGEDAEKGRAKLDEEEAKENVEEQKKAEEDLEAAQKSGANE